jgi:hypothetical protein
MKLRLMATRELHAVADSGEGGDELAGIVRVELGAQAADPGAQVLHLVAELRTPDAAQERAEEHSAKLPQRKRKEELAL